MISSIIIKKNLETKVLCFDYNDGKVKEHRILEIPYDWNSYNKIQQADKLDKIINDAESINREVAKYLEWIKGGEGKKVEFKSTLCFSETEKKNDIKIKLEVAKTIVAFLNTKGGLLFIGVNDKKELIGLENDYKIFKNNKDVFLQTFANIIKAHIGNEHLSNIDGNIVTYKGFDFMVVEIFPSTKFPAFLTNEKREKEFYVRSGSTSQKLDVEECVKYVLERFKNEKQ